jgi:hypothetical protein
VEKPRFLEFKRCGRAEDGTIENPLQAKVDEEVRGIYTALPQQLYFYF